MAKSNRLNEGESFEMERDEAVDREKKKASIKNDSSSSSKATNLTAKNEYLLENSYHGYSYPYSMYGIARFLAPGGKLTADGKDYIDAAFLRNPESGYQFERFNFRFDKNFFLIWPPNLFALTSQFLDTTGAYVLATSNKMLMDKFDIWTDEVDKIASEWRNNLYCHFSENFIKTLLPLIPRTNFISTLSISNCDDKICTAKHALNIQKIDMIKIWERWTNEPPPEDWEFFSKNPNIREHINSLAKLIVVEHISNNSRNGIWDNVYKAVIPPRKANCNDIWRNDNKEVFYNLWKLHAIADRACMGWGLRPRDTELERINRKKIEDLYQVYISLDEKKDALTTREKNIYEKTINEFEDEIHKFSPMFPEKPVPYKCKIEWYKNYRNKTNDKQILEKDRTRKQRFENFVTDLLSYTGNLSFISNERARVLPKRHTPFVGATLRTASSFIAYHKSPIRVKWRTDGNQITSEAQTYTKEKSGNPHPFEEGDRRKLNILLLPIPEKIRACNFRVLDPPQGSEIVKSRFSLFEYIPQSRIPMSKTIELEGGEYCLGVDKILKEVKRECGSPPDLVVLPECAIADSDQLRLENTLRGNLVRAYVAGIYQPIKPSDNGNDRVLGKNKLCFGYGPDPRENKSTKTFSGEENKEIKERYTRAWYYKQHRWKLDKSQIVKYDLGSSLHPSKEHWEGIEIGEREALFVNMGNEMTICPIICEDLARQESLSELIRSVGPSLVITLLMDGPQIKQRWSAQYASVFSEDPGCANLTLTCKGMIDRHNANVERTSNKIALWCERGGWDKKEIPLEKDSKAVLLSLAADLVDSNTIDGRTDAKSTFSFSFGGATQIKV